MASVAAHRHDHSLVRLVVTEAALEAVRQIEESIVLAHSGLQHDWLNLVFGAGGSASTALQLLGRTSSGWSAQHGMSPLLLLRLTQQLLFPGVVLVVNKAGVVGVVFLGFQVRLVHESAEVAGPEGVALSSSEPGACVLL